MSHDFITELFNSEVNKRARVNLIQDLTEVENNISSLKKYVKEEGIPVEVNEVINKAIKQLKNIKEY